MSRADRIRSVLVTELHPEHLEVIDESHMHSVPKGAESHFKLVIAAAAFEGKNRVARHRAVNALLKAELDAGLHALTLTTFTPQEWSASPDVQASPACLGGSKAG